MKITPHFRSEEFDQPARHDFQREPYPEKWHATRLRVLCDVLEVIRKEISCPIKIVSGYRSEAYNKKIGGARHSQHVQGRAADIQSAALGAGALHDMVLYCYKTGKLPFLGGLGLYPTFVHVDVRPTTRLARWTGSRNS